MNQLSGNEAPTHFLYGQSTLRKFGIEFKELEDITPLILTKEIKEKYEEIKPVSGFKSHVEQIQDICEKLDFLRVCNTTLQYLENHREHGVFVIHIEEAKFFFYMFIYNLKALMDSISILLKIIFTLAQFKKGQIDIIRNIKYQKTISERSSNIGGFLKKYSGWTKSILNYRDCLIHRNTIPIFIRDLTRNSIFIMQYVRPEKDGPRYLYIHITESESIIALDKERERVGLRNPFNYVFYKKPTPLYGILQLKNKKQEDFISITDFCQKSFLISKELIELTYGELYVKLTT